MARGFKEYMYAQAETREAVAEYNAASTRLELAKIKERFAELYSQTDPIEQIKTASLPEREKLCASAYYILFGSIPREGE